MESQNTPATPQFTRGRVKLLALSAMALVLGSLDQCTRGPSLTAMLLNNLNLLF